MVKVNYSLLPVKTHYLFFMAAMGPILPFLPVMGKQLGVSEVVMGILQSVIPILFFLAKPIFGFILDFFQSKRKTIFISLIISTTFFFSLLRLMLVPSSSTYTETIFSSTLQLCDNKTSFSESACQSTEGNATVVLHLMKKNSSFCSKDQINLTLLPVELKVLCNVVEETKQFYTGVVFWGFVLILSLGSIGYNVANSVSDAICFDVLGTGNEKSYGAQRVWGTVGFGLSALLGGYGVDLWSAGADYKDYTPAFLLAIGFTSIDLLCCTKLKLPTLPKSQNIMKDVTRLIQDPSIATFLLFAAFQGICESFIIYFMFWYLEDLAEANGMMGNIKLLEGLTVAAETLVGEVIFFPLSGKILNAVGYRNCLSLCFLAYALRLGLLSVISNPWWAVAVELLQGPSYALSYTTVVAYASAISPPGTSATMQGIAAGVDDGFGYSAGSLIGGFLYRSLGGSLAFRLFSGFAFTCSITHWLLYVCFFRRNETSASSATLQYTEKRKIYNPPKEAAELVETAS